VDECPLGMVEEAPASLRAPGASVVRAFTSDRQKHETAAEEGILTKIVMGAPPSPPPPPPLPLLVGAGPGEARCHPPLSRPPRRGAGVLLPALHHPPP
jgi:hypothetical protein